MRKTGIWIALAAAAALSVPTSRAQEHQHSHGDERTSGRSTSRRPAAPRSPRSSRAPSRSSTPSATRSRAGPSRPSREGSRLRHGVLGNRDDLLPSDLGAAEPARSSPPGKAAAGRAAELGGKDRAGARVHRRDRRLLPRLRDGSVTARAPRPTARRWRSSRGASPTTTRPRSSTPSRFSARLLRATRPSPTRRRRPAS